MANSIYKWYKDLPPWAKGVVVVGSLAGTYFAAVKGINAIKTAIDKARKGQALQNVNDDLYTLATQGIFPSYSEAQYKLWADAMEQCYQGYGTCSGDTIFVNMKNDADILKLINAFGVRTISSGKWNPTPDTTGDLVYVIRDELSTSEIESVNSILADKGIKYRF